MQAEKAAKFWDIQYSSRSINTDTEEWICGGSDILKFVELSPFHSEKFKYAKNVLEIGCGDPALSEILAPVYQNSRFLCVDISVVAVSNVRDRCILCPLDNVSANVVDITNLPSDQFPDKKFDIIIDKGTSDTLQFRVRSRESRVLLEKLFRDMYRILAPNGIYIIITPKVRIRYLHMSSDWKYIMKASIIPCEQAILVRSSSTRSVLKDTKASWICWVHTCIKSGEITVPDELVTSQMDRKKRPKKEPKSMRKTLICFQWLKGLECVKGSKCLFNHFL